MFLLLVGPAPSVRAEEAGDFYPLDYGRRAVSGSFGEYRPGHLHAGIDLATFGKTGVPVRALADGRVYRLRSSAGGYGNVIYLQHADGRRSVYAHLKKFIPSIAALLPRPAHELGGDMSGNAMEVYPTRVTRVRRGQVIGWVGESGSGLPHLHLEVRDGDDRPIHPVTAGLLAVRDRVPPAIHYVLVEPADGASSVNGGASPWLIDSTTRGAVVAVSGRVRVLVSASDVDGAMGGTLAPRRLRLFVGDRAWTTIEMRAFTYGRDKEWASVYDAYRTGFGPTTYVFDLTGPDGAAEVVRSGGLLPSPSSSATARIEVEDMAGLSRSLTFRLSSDSAEARGGRRATGDHGEHIGRGGVAIVRGGSEHRVSGPGMGRIADARWSGVEAVAASDRPIVLLDRVRIIGAPRGAVVYAVEGSSLPRPSQAMGAPLLVGPFGLVLEPNSTVSVTGIGEANGLARYRNGSWSWIGGSRQGDLLAARLDVLLPLVPVRDTDAPRIELVAAGGVERTGRASVISVIDDFSGVDAESVEVRVLTAGDWVRVAGRFDRDRDHFIPVSRWSSGQRLRVTAHDEAGNGAFREIDVP